MSLLKRIESARPAGDGAPVGAALPAPPPGSPPAPGAPPGTPVPPPAPLAQRTISQVPVRESFRDTKYRIQQRVISDLDPKLDLTNQVEVVVTAEHAVVIAWLRSPLVAILCCTLIVAIFYHGQLGVQVVLEDYIHAEWLKLASIVVTKLSSLLLAAACLFAVLSIAFRS